MTSMHFGFLSLDYPTAGSGSGVGSQIRLLARELVKAGHRATVIALGGDGTFTPVQDEGVQVYRMAPGNIHWYVSRFPGMNSTVVTAIRELEYSKAVWSAVRAIQKKEPFDLLEGTETGAVCTALWSGSVPLVIRLHGEEFTFQKYTPQLKMTLALRLSRMIQKVALRRSRLLISPSCSHLREISGELAGVHPPIDVIPNSVPAERELSAAAPREEVRAVLDAEGPVVLYTGRLDKRKGVPTLLEAAPLVHRVIPECRFVLAGALHSTFRKPEIDAMVDRLQLREFVHFLGHVRHEELAPLYDRAAVTVLPSYYETFGLSALESMDFGVPVVASASGSLPEVVADGVTGLLVPPGNAEALSVAIIRLLQNAQERGEMSQRARESAQQFHVAQQMPKTLQLYEWATSRDLHESPEVEHIFFSPHPDDAVLSCGGFIASLTARHYNVRVVTVFAAGPGGEDGSAFTRHLQSKWGVSAERKHEDLRALRTLGVDRLEQWDFTDAPWRADDSGNPIYASYEELGGPVALTDASTTEGLRSFLQVFMREVPESAVLYFPLSIGGHVDHRHLFQISLQLRASGRRVRFYEDWPYTEMYTPALVSGWLSRTVPIDTERKLEAIQQYASQIPGLGGDTELLRRRLERFTHRRGVRDKGMTEAVERYWEISASKAEELSANTVAANPPFERIAARSMLKDFGEFVHTLSWRELESCLPVGRGICVDAGCGNGRHRPTIENRGYRWIGADRSGSPQISGCVPADFEALPFASTSVAAVVAWQVMEYLPKIESAVREAWRVLETGGVFCGSVSYLEPTHGRTYGGISPLGLRSLLEDGGFKDIQIFPGLCGFSLMAWTWMRRLAGPWAGRLALMLAAGIMLPPMAVRFLISWIAAKLGLGTGHGMRWVAQQAPLEFAGQLVFLARKPAQRAE